jgi:protein tyrosine phosphatase (PTP) superfamily phosphohydrolase (DUF442 family)
LITFALIAKSGWLGIIAALTLTPAIGSSAEDRQSKRSSPNSIDQLLQVDVPVVLCIDDNPAAGGQPSGQAYAKAAASGYRSILTLRNEKDGIDLLRERAMVEQQKLRYYNIPVVAHVPNIPQAEQFLALTRDKNNHPMLINCAFAERVAPLIMIFRIIEQGWSKEKAIAEAARLGLGKERLRKFADAYLAQRKPKTH